MSTTTEDTVTSRGFQILCLTGKENYKTWRVNMVDILSEGDLLKHIEQTPEELYLANATEEAKAKIRKCDQRALGQIWLWCNAFTSVFVEDEVLAKDAWVTLWTEFKESGGSSQFILQQLLYASKMVDGDDLDIHL